MREVGPAVSEVLKHRVADLRAATSVTDILTGNLRFVPGTNQEEAVLDLCEEHTLVFAANHPILPREESGNVDWKRVTRIKLLRIHR